MNIEGSSGIREPFPLLTDFPPQSQKTIQGLMRAAKEGVRTLQESERGETIVHEVVRLHDYKIFKLVFKNGTPFLNIPDAHGRTPLHQAALLGDYSLVLELLKSGAHHVVNLPDHQGITPLHAAVISNNVQMAELLLSFGAEESVNAVLTDFSTPLHSAVSRKNAQMVELLLEHGAAHSINAADSEGQTPKQLAIVTGCVSIVQLMFEKSEEARASLNQPDSIYHITDLQRAARNGNMEMKGLILFHSVEEEIKASTDAFFPEGERLSCLVPSERELLESLPIDQIFFPLTIAQNFCSVMIRLADGKILRLQNADVKLVRSYLMEKKYGPEWHSTYGSNVLIAYLHPSHSFVRLECTSCDSGQPHSRTYGFYPSLRILAKGAPGKSKEKDREVVEGLKLIFNISSEKKFYLNYPQKRRRFNSVKKTFITF